jgi:predicted short-subunit dehydrogenase-like oxidoreductase (DUF2520 family)
MRISLIGAGNLATHLGLALIENNHQILQVYSKTLEHASLLGSRLNCPVSDKLSDIVSDADIYIIAVKDYAIQSIVESVDFGDRLVVHTSGAVPISVFNICCKNHGVFYPLQTFSREKEVNFKEIPILIEANKKQNQSILMSLASTVSREVVPVTSEGRLLIHLAAVFACNFVNHFYYIAKQLLVDQQFSLDLLKPLILETTSKALSSDPGSVQTGPAIRNEKVVMDKHLRMLSHHPEWARLYQLISENIRSTHKYDRIKE